MEFALGVLISVLLSIGMIAYAIVYALDWLGARKKVGVDQSMELMGSQERPVVIVHGPGGGGLRVTGVVGTLRVSTVIPDVLDLPSHWTVLR